MSSIISTYSIPPKTVITLNSYASDDTQCYPKIEHAEEKLLTNQKIMADLQEKLYAQNSHALLIIFQAMDAAGKDSAIKHVLRGLNPQGVDVRSFKIPSQEDLDHDYLWRINKVLPERGRIGIFNRSYYEEVLVVRVHPEYLVNQHHSIEKFTSPFWQERFTDIVNYEQYLANNKIIPIKIFLNVSKKEQKKRFLERITTKEKNWKFNIGDIAERKLWDTYMKCYEDMLSKTSTEHSPWYVVPADNKWYTRTVISDIIVYHLQKINPEFRVLNDREREYLEIAKKELETE